VRTHAVGLGFGVAIGVVMAWARLSDPVVIRDMLLLREYDVFLLMGSAVFVAGVGVRMLRRTGVRALATGEEISWTTERPQARHFAGAALFGAGWSLAGTCPGPVAAMIGEGMIFKPYYYFETGCAAYLFGCGGLGKCAVVDAHEHDVDAYLAFAAPRACASRTSSTRTSTPTIARAGPRSRRRSGATYGLHESADVASRSNRCATARRSSSATPA
jgi:hypothetical protein